MIISYIVHVIYTIIYFKLYYFSLPVGGDEASSGVFHTSGRRHPFPLRKGT